MFGKSYRLFKLFGFEVRIDLSWLILAVLITWSLATGVFPNTHRGLLAGSYWVMGLLGALGLFFSIIFHELCHSLVARRFGVPIKGITLFIFGGVAQMDDEPGNARSELLMAIAGPASSVILGSAFFILRYIGVSYSWPQELTGILSYLWYINWLLAGFNLLPAFPLDGGRVLRAILWSVKKDLRAATRISSRSGTVFGFILMFAGGIQFLTGNFIGGLWTFMIGMFLHNASRTSFQQLVMRQVLEGKPVIGLMKPNPVTAPSSITVAELVDNYVYKYHYKMFPVVDDGTLIGCISTREIKQIPRSEWQTRKVHEISTPCLEENTIAPGTDALNALALMNRTGRSRIMVVQDGRLLGVLTIKDIMEFLALKMDLENQQAGKDEPQ